MEKYFLSYSYVNGSMRGFGNCSFECDILSEENLRHSIRDIEKELRVSQVAIISIVKLEG